MSMTNYERLYKDSKTIVIKFYHELSHNIS